MPLRNILPVIICLVLLISTLSIQAQFYSAGQAPGSVRYSQINTQNFQVIFPQEYESHGRYIADILEYAYEHATVSLEHRPRKVSVIVHNQTVISNGFVSWAPRRIELFTNPPADNKPHDWMEYLVVHELRHVVQIDKLNQGMTRLLGILFGEQAIGGVLGLFVPLWFLEGDAVVTETALTHAGRGRAPSFEQGLRAQVLSRGTYSFDKAVYGSYKDYVPNHYELGYQLVAAARVQKGSNVWAGVIDNVAHRPWSPIPFSRGMKRNIGATKDQHYHNTFQMLDSAWTHQKELYSYTQANIWSANNRLYTNYNQPYWINDSTVIALKTGLRDIPRIVSIDAQGREKALFAPGWYFPHAFHFAGGKLVWNEQRPDPRWEHRNWSEIVTYDLESKVRRRITEKGRYFAPSLSPDGQKIAAIETNELNEYFLVVLDVDSSEELFRYSYPGNDFLQTPAWHPEGEKIALIALDETGKRLDLIDLHTSEVVNILPATYTDFSSPRYWGEDILINGTWSGIDNIYKFNVNNENLEQIVSAKFGAVNGIVNEKESLLVYAAYTDQGYKLKTIATDELENIQLEEVKDYSPGFHEVLERQETTIVSRENIPVGQHEVENYSRLTNLFNLHSWAPVYVDANNQEVNLGASLLFQNMLSTSFATLGYLWDANEQTGTYSAVYSYQGWYPVFDLRAETGHRKLYYRDGEQINNFLFTENTYRMLISVPLRYRQNEYFSGITPFFGMGYNQALHNRHTPDTIFVGDNQFFTFKENMIYRQEYRFLAFRQIRSVERDIYPRWGQVVDINYRHTPFSENPMGSIFAIRGIGYFPGLIRHHGVRLSASYQRKGEGDPKPQSVNYSFGNMVLYPRGFNGLTHEELGVFSADYAFPLLYPDMSIKYLLYLKRLRAHLFTDYATARLFYDADNPQLDIHETFYSYGLGITGDMHLFRFLAPISLGVEIAFPHEMDPDFRMIMGISF